jgi:hypothetical protein
MEDAGLKPGATQTRRSRLRLLSSRALKREGSAVAFNAVRLGRSEMRGGREILRLRVATENRKRRDIREEEIATLRSE